MILHTLNCNCPMKPLKISMIYRSFPCWNKKWKEKKHDLIVLYQNRILFLFKTFRKSSSHRNDLICDLLHHYTREWIRMWVLQLKIHCPLQITCAQKFTKNCTIFPFWAVNRDDCVWMAHNDTTTTKVKSLDSILNWKE